ncbi:MAG: biopolymer transporter ExbD [Pseudomonadota bacterium]
MSLKARKPRKRASITSLIDVIFLLLLFFMLSSTFSRFSEVEISIAETRGESSGMSTEQASLVIERTGTSLGVEKLSDEQLIARLSSLVTSGTTKLTVIPAEGVVTQRLIDALTLMSQVPGLEISLSEPAA